MPWMCKSAGVLILLLLPLTKSAEARPNVNSRPNFSMQNLNSERALHVDGRELRDPKGQAIQLRGTNLGGWLTPETWMCGMKNKAHAWRDERLVQTILEQRFGEAKAQALMESWYDNWITEKDLDLVEQQGFNLIRVGFGYRNFQSANGQWRLNSKGEIDFSRLDWLISRAASRNIYVILDFHEWRGQWEHYDWISKPEAVEARAEVEEIWFQIAQHYKGNGAIAAFDLINEPAPSPEDLVQVELRKAVRRGDPDRIVAVEWADGTKLVERGFTNTIYSIHWYDQDPKRNQKDFIERSEMRFFNAPIWIGEWHNGDVSDYERSARAFNEVGWNWSTWNLKGVNVGSWSILNYKFFVVDLEKDSYEAIQMAWGASLRWNSQLDQSWIDGVMAAGLKSAAQAPLVRPHLYKGRL